MFRFILGILIMAAAGCGGPSGDARQPGPPAEDAGAHAGHGHGEAGERGGHAAEAPEAGIDAETVDWCAGHGVPESICTRCNPDLIAGFKAKGDWCAGHGLPESQCTLCNPDVHFEPPAAVKESSERHGADGALFCYEHDVPESECALCSADLAPVLDRVAVELQETGTPRLPQAAPKIRLASKEAAAQAGLRAVRIDDEAVAVWIRGSAELRADENRSAFLAASVPGIVRQVMVNEGDRVERGQVLCRVTSPEVAEARAAIQRAREAAMLTRSEAEREQELWAQKATSRRELDAALARSASAAADLGAAEARLDALAQGDDPRTTGEADPASWLLRAPQAGYVSARHVRPGDVVESGTPLLDVADLDHLWADLALGADDIVGVSVGDRFVFEAASLAGRSFEGRVLGISPAADARNRMVRVRAALDNAGQALRPGLLGVARIPRSVPGGAIGVPRSAVLRYADRPVAFVRLSEDLYEVRPLVTGAGGTGTIQVLAGLVAGEEVVTDGAFLLKTQITRGSIGAGCCELPPGGADR